MSAWSGIAVVEPALAFAPTPRSDPRAVFCVGSHGPARRARAPPYGDELASAAGGPAKSASISWSFSDHCCSTQALMRWR
jgi:hypothetical protein